MDGRFGVEMRQGCSSELMAAKNLRIDQLELDVSNPRFNKADGQVEAMQRIIEDQDVN
jgi:hypothetical protein